MLLWSVKQSGTYQPVKTPSVYEIELEDLDSGTFRSIKSGDLQDNVVGQDWSKIVFEYNYLTESEAFEILQILKLNPLPVEVVHPLFTGGKIKFNGRCSRKKIKMLQTGDYALAFNIVQKKRVAGQ